VLGALLYVAAIALARRAVRAETLHVVLGFSQESRESSDRFVPGTVIDIAALPEGFAAAPTTIAAEPLVT
jgi:hypothetical protein